ncbi:protein OXIDATIVE STRESS 3-like [Alnus glutinosa]|uniref:protein OXIDATIVE STRESS 3-like n=1 Tax=Alnus glutinosa TaxID=3517 RepID=UPI002D78B4B1|nr:protein OXIDATIVE STRESS 3-like [Alnus glutinosa]
MDSSSAAMKQQSKHGVMAKQVAQDHQDHHDHLDSSSSSFEVSTTVGSSSSSSDQLATGGPLSDLSSLLQQLPIKRGLSKHYQGKSRSFASLSGVRCMEDLVKAEYSSKKLKSCKSYVGLSSSRVISKKLSNSRGSCSFLGANARRPPISPHTSSTSTSSSISTQTALFA